MRIRRNVIAAVIAALALGTSVAGIWTGASGESQADAPSSVAHTGIGETLLLVVADVVDAVEAASGLRSLNLRFGELQGFYADPTDAYDVIGALVQTSADVSVEPCPDTVDALGSVVGLGVIEEECPVGGVAKVLQPVTTSLVRVDQLAGLDQAMLCARSGNSCGIDRIRSLLGDDLDLDAGATLFTTAFRTKRGAEEFIEFARAGGMTDLVTLQARKVGGGYVGLGQEPAPDGSGPLTGPLVGQESYQR